MLAAAVAAVVVTRLQTPIYESAATVRIEEEQPPLGLLSRIGPSGLAGLAGLAGASDVQTDIMILRSRQIAEAIVDSLALRVRLQDQDIDRPRAELLQVVRSPPSADAAAYTLTRQQGGRYQVKRERGEGAPGDAFQVRPGRPFRLGGLTLAVIPQPPQQLPAEMRIEIVAYRSAVAAVQKKLRVERLDPTAQLVRIGYTDPDPRVAAAVPNVATHRFVRLKNTLEGAESNVTLGFLREQVAQYGEALREAEGELQRYREQARVISPEDQASEEVRRFAELRAERESLEEERSSLAALLNRLERTPTGANGESSYRQLASFPLFLSNGTVQDVLRTLTELETERSKLLTLRTPQNQDVQVLTQRIRQLEQELRQLARNYVLNLDNKIAAVEESLARSDAQLTTIPASQIGFLRRSREQKLLEEVYGLLQTRLKEEEIKASSEIGNITVIDPALVPEAPATPRPLLNLAVALLLGGITGVGAAFLRHKTDHKVRTREDVIAATSGAPVLGVIPRYGPISSSSSNGRRRASLVARHPMGNEQLLVTRLAPDSSASEAYRMLRTRLAVGASHELPRVLMVTSALSGDGKSSSASNLAVTLAQDGIRTALVDADLRAGSLHELFGMSRDPGLSDVLLGRIELDDALREIAWEETELPLRFLPAGRVVSNPAELLGSPGARTLIARLRKDFDTTILDAPPLVPVADASILGSLADSTLVVARTGNTDRRALEDAAAQLRELSIPISGIVLRDADAAAERYKMGRYGL